MSIVYKFGGSTIRSASALRAIAEIIIDSKNLSFVVLSATYNTTNELEDMGRAALQSICKAKDHLETLNSKHEKLAQELQCLDYCKSEFLQLQKEALIYINQINESAHISNSSLDSIYSLGERYSTIILSSYILNIKKLKVKHIDAREVIITNGEFNNASPLFGLLEKRVAKVFEQSSGVPIITQGFIGRSLSGETTTLGREGSDYTASILAWALSCSKLVIWKDVGGIMSWDPKLAKGSRLLDAISYDEAQLLTECGAKVLFHRTMNPLRERDIPLEVKSIDSPDKKGTIISSRPHGGIIGIVEDGASDDLFIWICGNNLLSNRAITSFVESENIDQSKDLYNYSDKRICIKTNSHKKDSLVSQLTEIVHL